MIKKLIYTANVGSHQWGKLLLGIICLLWGHGVIADEPPRVIFLPNVQIVQTILDDPYMSAAPAALHIEAINLADVLTFVPSSSPYIRIFPEALILKLEVGKQYYSLPPNAVLGLHIGQFMYFVTNTLRFYDTDPVQLVAQIPNWEQLEEGKPMLLLRDMYEPVSEDFQQQFVTDKTYRFSHSMVVDKRGRILRGIVAYFIKGKKTSLAFHPLPNATLKINSSNLSLEVATDEKGKFSLYDGEGLYLEKGEDYQVEVFVDDVVVLSKTITTENAKYPEWFLVPEHSHFSEITGYVYDITGEPLAGVTLTAGNHTTTSNEKGYYQLNHLVVGATYALEASKEGYHFSPVEFTVGEGQPVTLDLVEKNPTQCLLYAVHDTEKSEAQLLMVDLSADELAITPLAWKPKRPEISLAVGHFDADEQEEIVTAAQKGHQTITLSELNGQTIRSFPTSQSGMLLAAGDLDGDGRAEIIAASRSANRNAVNVYAADSTAQEPIRLFDQNTRIAPAMGDLDGDGFDEIIAGSLLKADQVAIYNGATQERQVFSVFQAESRLRKKATSSGKAKDCEKQGKGNQCDTVTTPEQALNETSVVSSQTSQAPSASNKAADKPSFGVQVATGDFNADGIDEIVAAMATKGSEVEIYNANGVLQNAFTAFESQKGLVVTVGNVIGDLQPEIIVAEAKGNRIRGFSVDGFQLFEFKAIKSGTVSSLAVLGCLDK